MKYARHDERNLLFLILFLAMLVGGIFIQATILLNWDVSAIVHEAEKLLKGGTYVNDYFETNPPLIIYLSTLPIFLSHLIPSFSITFAVKMYIFLLSFASLFLSFNLLHRIFAKEDVLIKNVFFITLSFILFVLPIYEFGQREHLLVIFSLPYILSIEVRLQKKTIAPIFSLCIGLFAGIAFSLKPFFILIPIFLELYLFTKVKVKNWFRLEIMSMFVFIMLYSIFTLVRHPDYFSVVLPYVSRLYYLGVSSPFLQLLSSPYFIFSLLMIMFHICLNGIDAYQSFRQVLLISLVGMLIVFILGRTSWYYHFLPAFSFVILNLVLLFSLIFARFDLKMHQYLNLLVFSIFLILFLKYFVNNIWTVIVFKPVEFFLYFSILFGTLLYILNQNMIRAFAGAIVIIFLSSLVSFLLSVDNLHTYQFILTIIIMVSMFYLILQGSNKFKFHYLTLTIFAIILFSYPAYFISYLYQTALNYKSNNRPLIEFLNNDAKNQSVYLVSTGCITPFVDYANAYSVSRFPMLWMIPGLAKNKDSLAPDYVRDKNFLIEMISTDLNKKKPKFVLIDTSKNKTHLERISLDYLSYFSDHEIFKKEWEHYHYQKTLTLHSMKLFSTSPQMIEVYKRD